MILALFNYTTITSVVAWHGIRTGNEEWPRQHSADRTRENPGYLSVQPMAQRRSEPSILRCKTEELRLC